MIIEKVKKKKKKLCKLDAKNLPLLIRLPDVKYEIILKIPTQITKYIIFNSINSV